MRFDSFELDFLEFDNLKLCRLLNLGNPQEAVVMSMSVLIQAQSCPEQRSWKWQEVCRSEQICIPDDPKDL